MYKIIDDIERKKAEEQKEATKNDIVTDEIRDRNEFYEIAKRIYGVND